MHKKAFTAVEVMVALFVAAMFIFAGYNLYVYVYQETSIAKSRAIASNIAEAHMKTRSTEVVMTNCGKTDSELRRKELPKEGEKLNGLVIHTGVKFPYGCSTKIIEVYAEVKYLINNIVQIEKQVLYVER